MPADKLGGQFGTFSRLLFPISLFIVSCQSIDEQTVKESSSVITLTGDLCG